MFFIPPLPLFDSAFDLATLSFIASLILLSVLSLCFIFHLRFRSRTSHYLQHFNSLWTVRFLLVSIISLWALNELLRVPFFRRQYIYPFLPNLTLPQQANLCKIHVVLSFGLLQPGFLVTLLYLVDVSMKKKPPGGSSAVFFVLTMCLPILALQIFFLFFSRLEIRLPAVFERSFTISKGKYEHETVLCAYPLLSTALFGAFAAVYLVSFLLSAWRVVSLVINKALRIRIYALALTVVTTLPLQVLFMGMSVLWKPERPAFGGAALVVFMSAFTCAAVGEGILVIRPIADSLAAEGDAVCHHRMNGEEARQTELTLELNNVDDHV